MGEHAKFCLFNQHLIFNFYMNICKQFDNNSLTFFQVKMQFILTFKRAILLCLTYSFTQLVIFLNRTNCIVNNRNILMDGSDEWRKIQRRRKNEM